MKIDHIGISVGSLERSSRFYGKYFGLRCVKKYAHKEAGLVIAVLKSGRGCLELFEFKERKLLPQYRKNLDTDLRTLGVKHLCFKAEDMDKFYNRLKKSRVKFAADMRVFDDGRRYFFVKDPDGILVEVMEKSGI